MDDKINEYQATLDQVNSQYEELQQKVAESEAQLQEAQEKYEKKLNLLKSRLVAIYKNGETKYLDVLMNSKSIIDFVSKYYAIQRIAEIDSQTIDELEQTKQELEKINNELEEDKAQMKIAKVEAEKQTVVLTNTRTVYENQKNSFV